MRKEPVIAPNVEWFKTVTLKKSKIKMLNFISTYSHLLNYFPADRRL